MAKEKISLSEQERHIFQMTNVICKLNNMLIKYKSNIEIYKSISDQFIKHIVGFAISIQFEKEYHSNKPLFDTLCKEIDKFNTIAQETSATQPIDIAGQLIKLESEMDSIKYESFKAFNTMIDKYDDQLVEYIASAMQNNGSAEIDYTQIGESLINAIKFIKNKRQEDYQYV